MSIEERTLPCGRRSKDSLHVLVADDDLLVVMPAIELIKRCGHSVTHVTNGREAIAAYIAHQPDMILMDVMMPVMGGIEATREIRKLAADRWIPLLMLTSLDSKEDMLAGFEAGADDYLAKPIDVDLLYARMFSLQRIALIQNQLHRIIDNAYEGIITIDEHGIIGTFNPAAESIFGYAGIEVIGKNVSVLMPSPDRERHDRYLEHYLNGGEPKIIGRGRKVTGLRKNGERFPMQLFVTRVPHPDGVQFIGLVRDVTQEEAEREKVEFLAHYDALTELPNRATFHEVLDRVCAQARTEGKASAVLFIDLDGFKAINDMHGHEVGDAVLVTVARRMRHSLAKDDFLGRLGGDEFVAILHEVDTAEMAGIVAARLIEAVGQPMDMKECTCQLGASIGIALTRADFTQPDLLLSLADDAMYEAKRQGKNRFVVASAEN